MATIKQIAALAGVSRGTVDRVLNNRGIVNSETASKVREIAATVHYTPNKVAKTLAVKKKNLKFGFILFSSTSSNPFFEDVVSGIENKIQELYEYGVTVEIVFSEFGNHCHQIELMDQMVRNGVVGIAITPINHTDVAAKIKQLTQHGIAVVTVNTDIENSGRVAYVGSNYLQSGRTAGALMRLFTGGKANIGIITGSTDVLCHSERVNGFKQSIGTDVSDFKIVDIQENHDDDFESFAITKALLSDHPEMDALFLAAAGVYGACRAVQAMHLTKKLTIVSFDCVTTTKKLLQDGIITATIAQQPFWQGSKPLDILFNLVAMDIAPKQEQFFTNIEIKIKENL